MLWKSLHQAGFILIFFFAFLLVDAAARLDESSLNDISSLIEANLKPYENEVFLGDVSQFVDGFIHELKTLDELPLPLEEIKVFLPGFLLRYIYFDGNIINNIMGRYVAVSFVYNIQKRGWSGCPVFTQEQAQKRIPHLIQLEKQMITNIETWRNNISENNPYTQIDLNDILGSVMEQIQIGFGSQKRSLSDPTYPLAPIEINEQTVQTMQDDFAKLFEDIVNLKLSNEILEKKYPGLIRLSCLPENKIPPDIVLKFRLEAVPQAVAQMSGSFYPNQAPFKMDEIKNTALKEYAKRHHELSQQKNEFIQSFLGRPVVGTSRSKVLKEKINQYFNIQ